MELHNIYGRSVNVDQGRREVIGLSKGALRSSKLNRPSQLNMWPRE